MAGGLLTRADGAGGGAALEAGQHRLLVHGLGVGHGGGVPRQDRVHRESGENGNYEYDCAFYLCEEEDKFKILTIIRLLKLTVKNWLTALLYIQVDLNMYMHTHLSISAR